jgi:hypothetical protein
MELIAYYLPQYYPFKENNEWWSEGFTEWTNVGKAKRLFKNHYQPKVPRDLGYYDLRLEETRVLQASLAKDAGIVAFCYWDYWFGGGKKLLDLPLKEVLRTKKPNFKFCLGWANESWKSKVWNKLDNNKDDRILIEQLYLGDQDISDYFYASLDSFRDERYYKFNGKHVFVIYKPLNLPENYNFIRKWQELAIQNGISNGFYFIGHTIDTKEKNKILGLGFDAINIVRIGEHRFNPEVIKKVFLKLIKFKLLKYPLVLNYNFISQYFTQEIDVEEQVVPTIIPNWDHTPRSGVSGVVFHNSTPELFKKHVIEVKKIINNKDNKLVFLKSWNEWGEGNYMEPDLKFGKQYLEALKQVLKP